MSSVTSDWHYPRWIAHRGAGKLAPENTLAAFRLGASYGFRMFECDVKLSADAVPFLLHDATLERTTNGHGMAGEQPWSVLAQLDAGRWHSRAFAGEQLATLAQAASFCIHNGFLLNLEIKPSPGTDQVTGDVVAQHVTRLWHGQAVPPLLSSFRPEALRAARSCAPNLPRCLLLDVLPEHWLETALELGCVGVVCNYALWNVATVQLARKAGLRALSYTVNDDWAAQRLIRLGTDGIITDRVDQFAPAA